MSHRFSTLVLASVVAIVGQARGQQAQMPVPMRPAGTFQPSLVMPASYQSSCGACGGGGCAICDAGPDHHHDGGCDSMGCGVGSSAAIGPMMPPGMHGGMMHGGMPGGMHGGMMGGGMHGGMPGGMMGGMPQIGGGGYASQMGQADGPMGTGANCPPMYYDFQIEYMGLKRDDSSDNIDITSRLVNGDRVLGTDDVELGEAHGFRATYAFLVGPATALEATYFGTHHWSEEASVTGNGDLYSVFSDFGLVLNEGPPPVLGYPGTVDEADFHSISYSSDLNNLELNLRQRWTSANCLFHGSFLLGFRYLSLQEEFMHQTRILNDTTGEIDGFLDYMLDADNHAFGGQIGAECFVTVSPRFKIGTEAKAGLMGNATSARNVIQGRDTGVEFDFYEKIDQVNSSFVGELNVVGIFRLTPRWSIRGGYTYLVLDQFALGTENFNTQAPLPQAPQRVPLLENGGQVDYHGGTLGFTFLW